MRFDGETIVHPRDDPRLTIQYQRVLDLMGDGEWRTLEEISLTTGDPEASVSARLRDMRKPKFGAHVIERQYVSRGLFKYRRAS